MLFEPFGGHLSYNFVYRQPKLIENQNLKVEEQAVPCALCALASRRFLSVHWMLEPGSKIIAFYFWSIAKGKFPLSKRLCLVMNVRNSDFHRKCIL